MLGRWCESEVLDNRVKRVHGNSEHRADSPLLVLRADTNWCHVVTGQGTVEVMNRSLFPYHKSVQVQTTFLSAHITSIVVFSACFCGYDHLPDCNISVNLGDTYCSDQYSMLAM